MSVLLQCLGTRDGEGRKPGEGRSWEELLRWRGIEERLPCCWILPGAAGLGGWGGWKGCEGGLQGGACGVLQPWLERAWQGLWLRVPRYAVMG